MRERIVKMAEDRRDEIVARLQELVRIDTRNPYCGDREWGGEKAGQEYLRPLLQEMGAKTTLLECPADIYQRMGVIGPAQRDFTDRPNLVGKWNFGGEGPTVIINGHMDTVGAEGMTIDPFAAQVRDGKIWGRGTSDCKGGLIVGLAAIKLLLELDLPLSGSLIYQSVVDEECSGGGAGTLACIDAGYTGDGAIFVDGNDLMLILGCGGCLTADVTVTGKEGHAALGTGVSAIDKGFIIKQTIDDFKRERETEYPACRVNLGIFRSGVHAAVVPGSAHMSLNIVYDVVEAQQAEADGYGWGGKPIRERFEQMIRAAEAKDEWLSERPSEIVWVKDLIPFDQPDSDPWAQRLAGVFREVLGQEPVFNRMMAWSDSAYPKALAGIPTVLFGPATSGEAHGPTEHIEIEQIVRCTQVLATLLADLLAT